MSATTIVFLFFFFLALTLAVLGRFARKNRQLNDWQEYAFELEDWIVALQQENDKLKERWYSYRGGGYD